jgi:hypothetical protein
VSTATVRGHTSHVTIIWDSQGQAHAQGGHAVSRKVGGGLPARLRASVPAVGGNTYKINVSVSLSAKLAEVGRHI